MAFRFESTAKEYAIKLDKQDPLAKFRELFAIPPVKSVASKVHDPSAGHHTSPAATTISATPLATNDDCVYFCGNSLGLMPKSTRQLINEELDVWSESGVHGHFHHKFGRPWVSIDEDNVNESMAKVVGAKLPSEVAIMNSLTVNLHFFMISFYQPTDKRYKIIMEAKSFPSDQYAIESQLKLHGYTSEQALIQLEPREGEMCLRTEDIVKCIEKEGDSVALVLMSGVQYYTGQLFEMEKITRAGHSKGCMVGYDLAHAVGNAVLKLHDWNVDFAVWCTYKYLNSGPGSIGGAFIHEKHHNSNLMKLCGWWGHDSKTRFQMGPVFDGILGALGYRMSNPCVLAVICLKASLDIFNQTSMDELNEKTLRLTGYLEFLLDQMFGGLNKKDAPFFIATPADPKQRGCQLSLIFKRNISNIFKKLMDKGIVCDKREPNCIRVAPVPLYNRYQDVWKFVNVLHEAVTTTTE